ncbi:TetR/AcrR family transcriptional regulator [Planomonospora sp. ID67723]|uniref:TetR/AcrR family transcriptional regulator n=1 Tax=Planomonospora sp. ID67723 TaxID=2738134 RepID=UPI0018C43B92|nr:TetR/AcrR family transcriptional regulator [Planomonospora sp. ID67723]MBG0831047.1 TetR/AcrR family transcriptional regulator [Planomonospora sp. ID67723]
MHSGGGARGSRADQADQRRAELLEAARKVVVERGLASTRVSDIAKATNVSGGLIHYHFATKDDLITEMLRSTSESEIQRLKEIVAGPESAVERLDRVLRLVIPASRDDQGWILWLDAWTVGVREEHVRTLLLEFEGAWIEILRDVITQGVVAGEFDCDDPQGAAERLDGMLDGLAIRYTLEAGNLSRARLLEHARVAAAREVGLERSAFPSEDVP